MKRRVTLPTFANNEIDAGYNPPAQASTLSTQQVFVNAPHQYGHPVVASK